VIMIATIALPLQASARSRPRTSPPLSAFRGIPLARKRQRNVRDRYRPQHAQRMSVLIWQYAQTEQPNIPDNLRTETRFGFRATRREGPRCHKSCSPFSAYTRRRPRRKEQLRVGHFARRYHSDRVVKNATRLSISDWDKYSGSKIFSPSVCSRSGLSSE
jgi:hypothetical protein